MSQTEQQQQEAAAGSPRPREGWELFWRVIAGLMVLVIAWILWVLYQVTPRSVVTPLAYANRIRPIGRQQPATGAAAPGIAPPAVTSSALQPAATATEAPTNKAQAALAVGAHQPSADVRPTAAESTEQQVQEVELRLATEISMPANISAPAAEKQGKVKVQEGASGSAPVAGEAGKQRP